MNMATIRQQQSIYDNITSIRNYTTALEHKYEKTITMQKQFDNATSIEQHNQRAFVTF